MSFNIKIGEYSMRPIKEDDLREILEWRNSERVHSMMLTNHKISWCEHKNWYENVVSKNEVPLHFIFEYRLKRVGYIGYTEVDFVNRRCSPGAYMGNINDDVPVDAGLVLAYMSIVYPLEYLNFHKVSTIVLEYNKRVYKMDKFIGYQDEGFLEEHFLKDNAFISAYMLGMLKSTWNKKKSELTNIIGGI